LQPLREEGRQIPEAVPGDTAGVDAEMKRKRAGNTFLMIVLMIATVACLSILALLAASCGNKTESTQKPADEQKYPPGTSEEMLTETTGSGGLSLESEGEKPKAEEEKEKSEGSTATIDTAAVDLAGARFTVIEATRQDSNADVLTSGQREVPGDYYEIELLIENVGDDIVDLSEYSFRIWSEGIDADLYEDYYGRDGTLGKYVSENMISATLLDYTTLQPAAYKLKMGESVDGVFLFFDLNPKNVARNEGVTKEGTNLVFYKARGDDSGEEVEINLAAYPD
jgi:flagellar basal body-associated protein FliL